MLTTALLLMFASADIQPAFLSSGAGRTIRLVQDPAYPPPEVSAPRVPPASDLPSYEGWTKRQLQQEYTRLKDSRPGLGLPIALMSSGGGVLVLSLYVVLLGVASSSGINSSSLPFLAIFGVVGTGGATMLIIGGILLARIMPERRIYGRQMDEVERVQKELGGEEGQQPDRRQYLPPPLEPPIIGPPPEGPPPLPLPPFTPQASVQIPLIFARF